MTNLHCFYCFFQLMYIAKPIITLDNWSHVLKVRLYSRNFRLESEDLLSLLLKSKESALQLLPPSDHFYKKCFQLFYQLIWSNSFKNKNPHLTKSLFFQSVTVNYVHKNNREEWQIVNTETQLIVKNNWLTKLLQTIHTRCYFMDFTLLHGNEEI